MVDHPNHPYLPAGYNSWEINGDEYDGAGANEPVWPELFDTFEGLTVLVLSPLAVSMFEECPDYTPGMPNNNIVVRVEEQTFLVREAR